MTLCLYPFKGFTLNHPSNIVILQNKHIFSVVTEIVFLHIRIFESEHRRKYFQNSCDNAEIKNQKQCYDPFHATLYFEQI